MKLALVNRHDSPSIKKRIRIQILSSKNLDPDSDPDPTLKLTVSGSYPRLTARIDVLKIQIRNQPISMDTDPAGSLNKKKKLCKLLKIIISSTFTSFSLEYPLQTLNCFCFSSI